MLGPNLPSFTFYLPSHSTFTFYRVLTLPFLRYLKNLLNLLVNLDGQRGVKVNNANSNQ